MAVDEDRRGYLDSYGFRLWTAMVAGSGTIWILLGKHLAHTLHIDVPLMVLADEGGHPDRDEQAR